MICERCYLEPVINGIKRIFLNDGELLKLSSSSFYDPSYIHQSTTECTLCMHASYEKSNVTVKVEGISEVYIDRKQTSTLEAIVFSVGSVFEILPGSLAYVLEFSNVRKECLNLPAKDSVDRLVLRNRLFRWEMFTGGQLFTCTSEGFNEKSEKVASFDLGGTLIKSKAGAFHKSHDEWTMWHDSVKATLWRLHHDGYKVVIFVNQASILRTENSLKLHFFKLKIENVMEEIGVPVQVHISTFPGGLYRKPVPGMWRLMEWNSGVKVNKAESFFVGDAAGREGDHAASDRIFALNIGIKFYTPEEYFLNEPPSPHAGLRHIQTRAESDVGMIDLQVSSEDQEVIIMIGPPSSGKTHFVETYLIPAEYVPVSLDYFDDWDTSVLVLRDILERKKKAVVDSRNWQKSQRWKFLYLCKLRKITVRCFVMQWTPDRCLHNNYFKRMFHTHYKKINSKTLRTYEDRFEPPTLEEGFRNILSIPFVPKFICDEMKFLYNSYLHPE